MKSPVNATLPPLGTGGGWPREKLADESVGTVILDEIFYPLNYGFISVAEVVDALKKITPGKGRCPDRPGCSGGNDRRGRYREPD